MRGLILLASLTAFVLVGVGAASSTRAPQAAQGRWVIRDLGTLGGQGSSASAINSKGQIVGGSETTSGASHAVLWENGRMTDLGALPGFRDSSATDINERGQVVGEGTNYRADGSTASYHAFLWQDGKMRDLGTFGGRASNADDINEKGQVVGWATTKVKDDWSGLQVFHAFLWENGKMRDLGIRGQSLSINNRGQVVGENTNFDRAFLWENGKTRTLTLGGWKSHAGDINDKGQVVGWSGTRNGDSVHAFLWQNGKIRDLGTLPGRRESSAEAINERGQVVGDSINLRSVPGDVVCEAARAVLWDHAKMIDLGALGDACGSVWIDINEQGQVIGNRTYRTTGGTSHRTRAFVWEKGRLVLLPNLPGGIESDARAINDRGQIIGSVEIAKDVRHAVRWAFKP